VFFTAPGLTFINAGSDLIYAAAALARLSEEQAPLTWAKRLAYRYVESRNQETGLGGYQFSISVLPGPGGRGDRAMEQFGEQLKAHRPIEATLVVGRQIRTIIGRAAVNKLLLGEALGAEGIEFLEWAVQDLEAYAQHTYDPVQNVFHPTLTNGLRLTGLIPQKSGYYGPKGQPFSPLKADFLLLWAYLMGYRLSRRARLGSVARSIWRANGLGDIGPAPENSLKVSPELNAPADPMAIFAVLELYRITHEPECLALAGAIADNLLRLRRRHGLFVSDPGQRYAKLDALEPLALLHLVGHLRNRAADVPAYWASNAFFGSAHENFAHAIDNRLFYGTIDPERRASDGS
jgi:pectate lyase